jgi:hypothetical protein
MTTVEDVTVRVSGSLAHELIERAGIAARKGEWALADGSQTSDPGVALRAALVLIAEDDLSATLHESIERLS